MVKLDWNTIFGGVQAVAASIATAFVIWAFFFSSLSQQVEESLRTEIAAAKQDLITTRQEKAKLELEKEKLVDSGKELTAARDKIKVDSAP